MRYAPTLVRLIVGWGGVFRCAFAHVEGVCDTPLHLFANFLGGAVYFVARSPTSGRMRYAPTVFGEIFGGRAITVKGTFQLKKFMPRRTGTFYLQKISARHTGSFWCFILHRLVIPVVFGVAICISSSYR